SHAKDIGAICRDSSWTDRVALQALRRSNGRAKVQERVHVDLVIVNADSAAHHEITAPLRLIGEAEARRKVISVGRENGVDPISLDEQSLPRDEDREILLVAMERSEILVPQTNIKVELPSDLPRILQIHIECVHPDKAFRISYGDCRG